MESGRHFTYEVLRGELREMYDPYHVTFSFIPVPGKEDEQCIAGWKAEFDLINPHTPLPEDAKDACSNSMGPPTSPCKRCVACGRKTVP
jgi:hypothetical protein